MAIIFNIIHNNVIKEALGPDEVLQVAIAADKFDCIVPLAYAIKSWLNYANVTAAKLIVFFS